MQYYVGASGSAIALSWADGRPWDYSPLSHRSKPYMVREAAADSCAGPALLELSEAECSAVPKKAVAAGTSEASYEVIALPDWAAGCLKQSDDDKYFFNTEAGAAPSSRTSERRVCGVTNYKLTVSKAGVWYSGADEGSGHGVVCRRRLTAASGPGTDGSQRATKRATGAVPTN